MRLELTCEGLQIYLANHYTTRGAPKELVIGKIVYICTFFKEINSEESFQKNISTIFFTDQDTQNFLYQRDCILNSV